MKITSIPRTWRHLKRYNQILSIFLKYGFTDLVDTARSSLVRRFGEKFFPRAVRQKGAELSRAERIRLAIEEAGPTFVKLGQILSMRPDILPPDISYELQKLHDQVAPLPYKAIKKVLKEELNAPPEEVFSHISEKPLAAASIAQVHRAELKSGAQVVLKVQRPKAKETIDVDVEILKDLTNILRKYFQDKLAQDPVRIVAEFDQSIHRELDFIREGRNIVRFKNNFSDDERLFVPQYFQKFSTDKLLVMGHVKGIKASQTEKLDKAGIDREAVARNGTALSFREIFEFGFFHADPHPGNIMVLKNNVIALLDFGMVGQIDDDTIDHFGEIIIGITQKDADRIIHAFDELNITNPNTDNKALRNDINGLIDYFHGVSIKKLRLKAILNELFAIIQKYRLTFPPSLSLTLKALITVDGLARVLYPEFDVMGQLQPFIHKITMRRYDPRRRWREMQLFLEDMINLAEDFPKKVRTILTNAANNRFVIQFEHHKLENLIAALNRATNRLSSALIIAALIVGSSLVIQLSVGPTLFGYPMIGLIGYLLACIFGLKLLWDMFRTRK